MQNKPNCYNNVLSISRNVDNILQESRTAVQIFWFFVRYIYPYCDSQGTAVQHKA